MTPDYEIKHYHWGLTLCIAFGLHLILIINIEQEKSTINSIDTNKNELIIHLKKYKSVTQVPAIAKPEVITKPQITQPLNVIKKITEPKPAVKKQEKKERKLKPVIKPAPVKEAVVQPLVNDAIPAKIQPDLNQPLRKADQSDSAKSRTPVNTTSKANYINEKNRYLSQLQHWLAKHKRYPAIARRRNLEGKVVVRFTIDKQGQLLSHLIVQPSVHNSLNKAAINMLKSAAPMPKVPLALIENNEQFEYTIPVDFNLVSQ